MAKYIGGELKEAFNFEIFTVINANVGYQNAKINVPLRGVVNVMNLKEIQRISNYSTDKGYSLYEKINDSYIKQVKDNMNDVIQYASSIKTEKKIYSEVLYTKFSKYFKLKNPSSVSGKSSQINYAKAQDLRQKLVKTIASLSNLKQNFSYSAIITKIKVPTVKINVSGNMYYAHRDYALNESSRYESETTGAKTQFLVPSRYQFFEMMKRIPINGMVGIEILSGSSGTRLIGFKSRKGGATLKEKLDEIEKRVDEIIKICNNEIKFAEKAIEQYKKGEKKEKKKFSKVAAKQSVAVAAGNKSIKGLNKTIKDLKKNGISQKDIKSMVNKAAAAAGMKITWDSGKVKSITRTKTVKSNNTSNSSSNGKVNTSTKQSKVVTKSLASKTNAKTVSKSKVKATGLVAVSAIGTSKTSIEQEKIESVKMATDKSVKEVAQISNEAKEKLNIIEEKRAEELNAIDKRAVDDINNISPDDPNAAKDLQAINDRRTAEINEVNAKYDSAVNNVNAEKQASIDASNKEFSSEMADIKNYYSNKSAVLNEEKATLKAAGVSSTDNDGFVTLDVKSKLKSNVVSEPKVQDVVNEAISVAKAKNSSNSFDSAYSAKSAEISDASSRASSSTEATGVATEVSSAPSQNATNVQQQNPNNQPNVVYPRNDAPRTFTQSSVSNNTNSYAETTSSSDVSSVDTSATESVTEPVVPADSESDLGDSSQIIEEDSTNTVISSSSNTNRSTKSNGSSVIPAVLGVGAVGAAAVAGARYVKNKKQNEDYDDNYDDEDNEVEDSNSEYVSSSNSYMNDDYLGPAGSEYMDTTDYESVSADDLKPDDDNFIDADALKDEDDFDEDAVMRELS